MKKKIIFVFVIAFIFRLFLVFSAYHGDLNNNISWGTLAVERGLNGFYESADESSPNIIGTEFCPSMALCERGWPYSAPNQPPLTLLMFAGLRLIWVGVNSASWWLNNNLKVFPSAFIWFWEARGMVLLIKLPGILADLGIGLLIFKYLLKIGHPEFSSGSVLDKIRNRILKQVQNDKERLALLVTCIWLFNPITWYNSTVWGQTDSIVNLLGLLAVLALLRKDLIKFAFWFTLSFLFKGSLGIFIPILGMIAIWQKHSVKKWLHATCYILLTAIFVSFWFHLRLDLIVWLFNLYKNRILPGEIGYLTANAFNFWWLVDPGKTLDSIVYLGLTARTWGILITLFGILGILVRLWRCHSERPKGVEESRNTDLSTSSLSRKLNVISLKMTKSRILKRVQNDKHVFVSLALVSLISFLFMTRIHERYLYPFFPYATLLLGMIPGMMIPYTILSISHLFNLYHLFWAPSIPLVEGFYSSNCFPQALSIINVFVFVYLLRLFKKAKI